LEVSAFAGALESLDTAALDREFSRLAILLTPTELVRDVLLPTLREVGDRWHRRAGGIAHEHVLTATMRNLLGTLLRLYGYPRRSARLLFATPSGERHEMGILSAAMLAAGQGLAVSYVGPDLPAREIVEGVKRSQANVLVLGLTLADRDKTREHELRTILRRLPARVEVWVGGPGTSVYAAALGTRAMVIDFDAYLRQLARVSESS
jgi:methanogenic corrinoid protein MtbC1